MSLGSLVARLTSPPSGRAARLACLLAAVVSVALVVPQLWHALHADQRLVDLAVYEAGGESLRTGRPLYEHVTPPPQNLPFTYPPFAALLAVPLSLVGWIPLGWAWTLLNAGLLAVIVALVGQPTWRRLGPRVGPLLFAGAAWLLPVRDIFRFGQVNLILVALVVLDCTSSRPRWPRGALVGVATAVKLTPALFIPYLWLSGRRRAAYVAAATAAGLTLATMVVLPGVSREYWLTTLWEPGRLGNNRGTSNQSLRGMLLRLDWPQPLLTTALLAGMAVVAVVGLRRAAQAARGGDEVAGLAITGCTAVLLSPVSWIHHLVWVVLAVAVLWDDLRDRRRAWAGVAVAAVFASSAPWWGARLARVAPDGLVGPLRVLEASFGLTALLLVLLLPHRGRWRSAVPKALGGSSTGAADRKTVATAGVTGA